MLIVLLTLCTRLFFAFTYRGPVYYKGIADGYLVLADNVIAGKGLVVNVDTAPIASGQSDWRYLPPIDRPLGYFFLVFVPYWLLSDIGIQIFQAILASVSALLLYRIALTIFTQKIAVVAGYLYALWPLSARFEVAILPDAVMPFFLLLGAWLLLKAYSAEKPAMLFILSGIAFGAGMMMRPDISLLPFAFIALFVVFKQFRIRFWFSFLLLVGVTIAVAPQAIRNYQVTGGRFIPLGLGNGISMWEGISQFGDTLGTVYGDEKMVEREGYRSWAYPNGIDRDRKRFKDAMGIVLRHPLWYAGMMARRIPVVLLPDGIIAGRFMPPPKQFFAESPNATKFDYLVRYPAGALIQIILITAQLVSLLLAAVSLLSNQKHHLAWIPGIIVAYYILVHLATNAEPRYFYPAIPFVLTLAAEGVDRLRNRFKTI